MNIGSFSFPVAPLILFASVAIALLVARFAGRDASYAETAITYSVIIGLVVARLAFIGEHLPAYHESVLKMLDFRDLGFDRTPGLVAGALVLLWRVIRRRDARRAVVVATFAGVVSWSAATAFADTARGTEWLPAVNVVDMDGSVHPLAQHDGKPLVVNLWASWCGPCRAEMPVLAQAQNDFTGVDIAFVNQGESRTTVSGFLAAQGLSLRNLVLDPSLGVARAAGAHAFPTTLFYDPTGKLLAVHLGPFSRATFQNALETLYPGPVAVAKR